MFKYRKDLLLASFNDMAERTITISNAANKIFNFIGCKIGWAYGPSDRITGFWAAKQYLSYCRWCAVPASGDLGVGHRTPGCLHLGALGRQGTIDWHLSWTKISFEVHNSYDTYFLCADPCTLGYDDSAEFCVTLSEKVGIAASRRRHSAI